MKAAIAGLVMAMAVLAASCGGDGGEPSPTATSRRATQAPTPLAGEATPSVRTGIAEIDAALNALFSGDADAVGELIGFTAVPCAVQPVGIGPPPECPDGVAESTPVDAFPQGDCEGYYTLPNAIDAIVGRLAEPGARLRAVYRSPEEFWPGGDYLAIYSHVGPPSRAHLAFTVVIREQGTIVGTLGGCGQTPEEFIEGRQLVDPLLFLPPSGLTGIPDLDIVLEALASGDPEALNPFLGFQILPCILTPEGIGAPPFCYEGDEPGTRTEALSVSQCESTFVRRDEIDITLQSIAETDLRAVYRDGDQYVALMSREIPDRTQAVRVVIEGRDFVHVDFTCFLTPEEVLASVPVQDVLVPLDALP